MDFFDNPFGGLFDFNRDGHTDMFEAGLGFAIMQDIMAENDVDNDGDWDNDDSAEELRTLQEKLATLNDRLFDLELKEPEDMFSSAYNRWEERHDALVEQIDEVESQISTLE